MANINVGRRADGLETSEAYPKYTGVEIKAGESTFVSGSKTGSVLSLECPFATQEMADNILLKIKDSSYKPFSVVGAIADPAAELGDTVTVAETTGGIFNTRTKFGRIISSDLSAPSKAESDHEYVYKPKRERKVDRTLSSYGGAIGGLQEKTKEIEEDYKSLMARVEDVIAGMDAYVLNDAFENYKTATARLFAALEDADAALELKVESNKEEVDGQIQEIETAQANLTTRVSGAETALEMQSQSIDGLESASAQLSARTDAAEASIHLQAEKINGVSKSVAEISADVVELQGKVKIDGTVKVENGIFKAEDISCNGDIDADGSIYAQGGLSCQRGPLRIGGRQFDPIEVTSTTGPVIVLGHA